jgi:Zn-dependent peptidase ImmA (M78 family)
MLANHLGIMIWSPSDIPGMDVKDIRQLTLTARESWSAATLRDGAASLIIINDAHAQTRQNNSLAHEIGHIVLEHEPAKMYVTPDGLMMMSEYNPMHEEEATWFAGAILLPRDALIDVIKRGINDDVAAKYYGVSGAIFRMRRNRTGVDVQLSRRRGIWAP